jgi:hypothetical protein
MFDQEFQSEGKLDAPATTIDPPEPTKHNKPRQKQKSVIGFGNVL